MVRGDGHRADAPLGSAETYLCLGPGWSSAANTPFRRHKTWVHEGGIATPLIAHWPTTIKEHGGWRRSVGHVIDVSPTILEVAGGKWPTEVERPNCFSAPPGRSFVDAFTSDRSSSRAPLWWLHEGNRALRDGDWKIVATKNQPWELYDLANDRTETNDLAAKMPDKLQELADQWEKITAQFTELRKQSSPEAKQARCEITRPPTSSQL